MYNFQLKWLSVIGSTQSTCFPRYSNAQIVADGISKRISFEGDLEFCGVDFDNIIAAPLLTKFYVIIKEGSVTIYTGYFTYEMMEVNYDAKIIKTTLKTDDYYERISSILDKEINLSDIDCKKVTTTFYSPILHQVYVLGDSECTCYCGGTSWKQECEIIEMPIVYTSLGEESGKYKNLQCVGFTAALGNFKISQAFRGNLNQNAVIVSPYNKFISEDGVFELRYILTGVAPSYEKWEVWQNNSILVWESNTKKGLYHDISEFTFTNLYGAGTTTFSSMKRVVVRALANSFNGIYGLPNANDFSNNFMYDYVLCRTSLVNPYKTIDIQATKKTQISETKYQKSSETGYFTKLESDGDYDYMPVGERVWSNFSIWVRGNNDLESESIAYKGTHNTSSFTLIDTIKAIFNYYDIKLNIKSVFFYLAKNPISGLDRKYPCLTQISNMHVKDRVFATRNIISLGEILQFLKDRFNIEWSVKDNYFRLEHIYFYENNEKYIPNNDFIDLTTKEASRLEKMWSELQNTCTFEIEHYREWLFTEENASDYLENGIIKTEYTTSENTRKSESCFYTDVNRAINADFKEGWFFGMYDTYGTSYRLEFNYVPTYKGTKVQLQNIYCMLPLCMEQYFGFNDYGTNVEVNGVNQPVRGFFRPKIQEIEVPYGGEPIPNFYKLVKTSQGVGFCKKIVVNLVQKVVKYTLKHKK